MLTQQTCSLPSGGTLIPPPILNAAINAGVASAVQGATAAQTAQNIAQAVSRAAGYLRMCGYRVDPNAGMLACQAGMQSAKIATQQTQMMQANREWYRMLQRQPQDFAGMPVNPAQINQESRVAATIVDPIRRAAALAAATNHSPQVCNPDFSDAPDVVPIDGDFQFQPVPVSLQGRL